MKGTTFKQKDRGRWAVSWYDEIYHKKCFTVTRYTPTWDFLWSEEMAEKQLRLMQHDWELHHQGKGQFRIEKYLGRGWTNVPEFYKEWMVEVVEQKRKPATIKGYWSYFFNWIEPFFIQDPIMLHEINLAILTKFMNYIKLEPKGKLNVMSAFHGMMDYAYRSEEIPKLPPFPKMEDYNIVEPIPEWIQRDLQMKIVGHIPEPDKWADHLANFTLSSHRGDMRRA